jgi:hypothetical protein
MVKVLPKGTNSLQSVKNHIGYIGRRGKVDLTSDDDEKLQGKGVADQLIADWDLELESLRAKSDLTASSKKSSPKLVHKVLFSMPPGTDPGKVLAAVQNFCREEFGLKHRYAMALHTDEPHPHIHLVLKAVSEQGVRLNIKKATLRHWRSEFARNLRLLGVEANATERAVRGESRTAKKDGIYRASLRGDSTYVRAQAEAVTAEILRGNIRTEPGKRTLVETRRQVESGWRSVANLLAKDGHDDLANDVRRFVDHMPSVRTERERFGTEIVEKARLARPRDQTRTR